MTFVNAKIDGNIAKKFRDTVYQKSSKKRGELTKSLEKAMLDYIVQYSEPSHHKEPENTKDE